MLICQWRCLALGLLLGVAAGGVAMLTPVAPMAPNPQAERPAEPPKAEEKAAVRVDRYGDPLPPGAVARLGTRRFRLRGPINGLAFAPDGKILAATSDDEICLFDVPTGKQIKQIHPADSASPGEHTIAFSPDGKRLAIATRKYGDVPQKCVVQVWECKSARKVSDTDAVPLVWLGWSPAGEPLGVFLEEGALRLRELVSGRSQRFECKELPDISQVRYLVCTCTPSGRTLAAVDARQIIHIWDTVTGNKRCTLQTKGNISVLALSPDGRTLASLTADTPQLAQLWDAKSGKPKHLLIADDKRRGGLLFSPDGKTLATVDTYNGVRFWDVESGRESGHTHDKSSFSPRIAFSPDGKVLATADWFGNTVHLTNVPGGKRRAEDEGHISLPRGVTFTPDGRRMATFDAVGGDIRVWDSANAEQLLRIHQPNDEVRGCAFSTEGRWLISAWSSGYLRVFDSATGQQRKLIRLNSPDRPNDRHEPISLRLSSDGQTLVSLNSHMKDSSGLITAWDTAAWKPLFQRKRPNWIGLVISSDTRVLAVPGEVKRGDPPNTFGRGAICLEDLATGERSLTFPTVNGMTLPLAFSPDGRLLVSCTHLDGKGNKTTTFRLWETAAAAEVLALPASDYCQAAFSLDGRLIALSAPNRQIQLWDLAQGRELRRFEGLETYGTTLAFSPDGRQLVSGLWDTTLLVWDVGRRERATSKLGAERTAKAWADLAGSDAPRAFRARWTLTSAPEEAVSFLKEHLHPAKAADPQRLRRLLADLDNEQFALREKAQEELEKLADLAEPVLRQTLANKPSLEMRQRVQALLDRLRSPVTQPELLQALRAVAVLEDIGTPEARRLLQELAKGAPEARLTREAKASLGRLQRRSASK